MSSATQKEAELDLIFTALSDARRRRVLTKLATGSLIVKEIGDEFDMSKPAVGKHVNILEKAGLIKRTELGRIHRCELNQKTILKVEEWLSFYREFWADSLDEMESYSKRISKRNKKK